MFLRSQSSGGERALSFTDATDSAGIKIMYATDAVPGTLTQRASGGVAAGDYDGDGNVDLYVIGGNAMSNALLRNTGRGTFEEVAAAAGVASEHSNSSGPLFFDFDGDGRLDLFVGATDGDVPVLYHNEGGGTFEDVTERAGLTNAGETMSATAGDFNQDGWLDLFLTHWQSPDGSCHLYANRHGDHFECVDEVAHIAPFGPGLFDLSFTANFVDVDADGWQDLLVTSDFGTSRFLRNHHGVFVDVTSKVISDENGMGSAIGDYDGDGMLDWFVTSVWDSDGVTEGDWGTSGNRLYRNTGNGNFEDVTERAGVREGDWGWAACFADLDRDGVLDLVHVNGWQQGSPQFRDTPARLFIGSKAGVFSERGTEVGFIERGGGRGLACFDYDGDGDVDLFVMNDAGPSRLWRNDSTRTPGNYLEVKLEGHPPNRGAIGAVVNIVTAGLQQVRELRAGSNYASQDPAVAHFGLGAATIVDELRVVWPDGGQAHLTNVPANQHLVIRETSAPHSHTPSCSVALANAH